MERMALERSTAGSTAARLSFVALHAAAFALWIGWNSGAIPNARPFDPFPFPVLTMWASVEAIFLALFLLIGQNRAARRNHQRAHLDLQINLLAELESTKALQMLRDLCEIHGLPIASDPEVQLLSRHTDPAEFVEEIRRSMPEAS